jgi:hypothetical protein
VTVVTRRDGGQKGAVQPRFGYSSLLVAVYAAGCRLNALDWHTQQAWLLPAVESYEARRHALAADDLLSEPPRSVRPALPVPARRRLEYFILSRRDVHALRESPQYLTEVDSTSSYIAYQLSQYADSDPLVLRAELWREAHRPPRKQYGDTLAANSGPLARRAVRAAMIQADLCRTVINDLVKFIRRAFRWAALAELIPAAVALALDAVDGPNRGRCEARKSDGVKPVRWEHVVDETSAFSGHPFQIVRRGHSMIRSMCLRQAKLGKGGRDVRSTQKPFVEALRVEARPVASDQRLEASLASTGVTQATKRRPRVRKPCY